MSDETPPSALHPELNERLARIEARIGEMFELMVAWSDEAQALRARQIRVEAEQVDEREERKRLEQRLRALEPDREALTEPSGLEPPEPELAT